MAKSRWQSMNHFPAECSCLILSLFVLFSIEEGPATSALLLSAPCLYTYVKFTKVQQYTHIHISATRLLLSCGHFKKSSFSIWSMSQKVVLQHHTSRMPLAYHSVHRPSNEPRTDIIIFFICVFGCQSMGRTTVEYADICEEREIYEVSTSVAVATCSLQVQSPACSA